MPETPLGPTPARDVFLRLGDAFSRRGKRGLLAASAVLLGAVAVVIYFTVFPIPRPAGRAQRGPPLDQSAVAVAGAFTKLGWNEHDCRAARRYSLGPKTCPSTVLPVGTYVFPLNTWLIQRHCGSARARPVSSFEGRRLSPGCIEYSAVNGETIAYTMAKMPQGWRIAAVKAHREAPIP